MSLKAVIKYELYDMKNALIIFYGIIFGLLIYLSATTGRDGSGFIGGMEGASIIFIFITGLNSFKRCFEFYQANGVSRKEQHLGFIIGVWIVSAGMALIDNISAFVFSKFLNYHSAFYQLFGNSNSAVTQGAFDLSYYLKSFFWAVFVYVLVFTMGYSITLLYYKMNRTWKIIVSVGVPVLFFNCFPMIDYWLNEARASYWLINSIGGALGITQSSHNPYLSVITTGLAILFLTLINHAMIRKTSLK